MTLIIFSEAFLVDMQLYASHYSRDELAAWRSPEKLPRLRHLRDNNIFGITVIEPSTPDCQP